MPTYQYECSKCRHHFETLQSMNDPRLKKCPACGKLTLERLIGAGSGIIFKGSGFYETDYKKKDSSKTESSNQPAKAPSPSGGHGCSPSCGCAA